MRPIYDSIFREKGPVVIGNKIGTIKSELYVLDDKDIPIAQIRKNRIVILFDITRSADEDSIKIMKYILSMTLIAMENFKDILEGALTLENYTEFCKEAAEKIIDNKTDNLKEYERKLKTLEREVFEHLKSRNDLINEVKAMFKMRDEITDKHREEYQDLMRLRNENKYKNFKIKDGILRAFTNNIEVEHKEKKYQMGEYEVILNSSKASITAFNLSNKRGPSKQHHPHISSDGSFCFGNVRNDMFKMLAAEQYAMLLETIYYFLSSYNETNPFCSIESWGDNHLKTEDERILDHFNDRLNQSERPMPPGEPESDGNDFVTQENERVDRLQRDSEVDDRIVPSVTIEPHRASQTESLIRRAVNRERAEQQRDERERDVAQRVTPEQYQAQTQERDSYGRSPLRELANLWSNFVGRDIREDIDREVQAGLSRAASEEVSEREPGVERITVDNDADEDDEDIGEQDE